MSGVIVGVPFFHGGNRGLRVGGFILPPSETSVRCTSDLIPNKVHRRDRVYVTPDGAGAVLYAAAQREPVVYEVEPIGALETDADCAQRGLSFACERARIIAVHKIPGKVIKRARKALLSPSPPSKEGE